MLSMRKKGLPILCLLTLCSGFSFFWGFALERAAKGRSADFKAVYAGTRCLLEGGDPYKESDLLRVFYTEEEGEARNLQHGDLSQFVTKYINMPTTFLFVAPFAALPWRQAHLIWSAITAIIVTFAAFLMWEVASEYSSGVSFYLPCIILADSLILFAGGNTAGVAVGLCVVGVWCVLKNRFVPAGVLCLAISLAIKPHDAGLIWLYFLLARGVFRKRAFQALAITCVFGVIAVLWVSHFAPNWFQEMRTNLTTTTARGGLNSPGPSSVEGVNPGMVIDLQSVISVFRDDPTFYNPVTYLCCGALLVFWIIITVRSRFSPPLTWLALAGAATLSMLPTYHRPHDAKLLMLTIPACAALWAEGGAMAWVALVLTSAGILVTSDLPLGALTIMTANMHFPGGLRGVISTILLTRPVPLILLALSLFYLVAYARRSDGAEAMSHASD